MSSCGSCSQKISVKFSWSCYFGHVKQARSEVLFLLFVYYLFFRNVATSVVDLVFIIVSVFFSYYYYINRRRKAGKGHLPPRCASWETLQLDGVG